MFDDLKEYNNWKTEMYFISYFFIMNLLVINVVVSFFVDNVMTALGEMSAESKSAVGEEEREAVPIAEGTQGTQPNEEEGGNANVGIEVEMTPVEVHVN